MVLEKSLNFACKSLKRSEEENLLNKRRLQVCIEEWPASDCDAKSLDPDQLASLEAS